MALTPNDVIAVIGDELLPAWTLERRKLDRIDRWARWDHDKPHKPKHATAEYRELSARAQAPWGDLIVSSVAQTLYVEGYRRPDAPEDTTGWNIWQANGMDGRQVALHRALLTYGLAYGTCLPGRTMAGEPMPEMRGVSPRDMIAVYDDPAYDDWPVYALRVRKVRKGWKLTLFDDTAAYEARIDNIGDKPKDIVERVHEIGVCPIVRYKNRFDLEGRSAGEIEPFIPLLGRIDQTTFDRLVVQRFASWIVRTIAGMDVPASADAAGTSVDDVKLRLAAEDFLTAKDADTKFGSLPASPLSPFVESHNSDLSDLSAVSQTPAFELMGGNLANPPSAESLAAMEASRTAKSSTIKHVAGEDHEQFLRLSCHVMAKGLPEGEERDQLESGAGDYMAQVRWADTSIRSIASAVDAYGKMTTMLGYPAELLWDKVPGFTKTDADEARAWVEEHGGVDALLAQIASATQPAPPPGV